MLTIILLKQLIKPQLLKHINNTSIYNFSSQPQKTPITLTFINRDMSKTTVTAFPGQHILQIAKQNNVQLQGACQASLACSTCHVILPKNIYDKLTPPVDQQQDLLDLAFGLTPTSRLGCQVKASKEMDGCEIVLPKASRNLYVDGTKPSSH